MNTIKKIENLSRNITSKMIKRDSTGWPPDCALFAYQPVRPASPSSFVQEETPSSRKPFKNNRHI